MKRRISDCIGYAVRASDGDVGTVEQFFFDDLTWSLRYMAVSAGGPPPGCCVLISLAALGKPDWKKRVFPVSPTCEQIGSGPVTDAAEPVSRQYEAELHAHYEWPAYWAGSFYVPPGFATSTAFVDDTGAPPGVRKVDPHLRGTTYLTGCRIHAVDGNIGHVEDCIVDDKAWAIRYLVVNTRQWLKNRPVLVSPRWIMGTNWAERKVLVDLTREAVRKSPAYDRSKRVSADYEDKLLTHLKKPEDTEWVIFKLHAPPGADVRVAGTFNNWDSNEIRMGDDGKGIYSATVLLPFGRHEYKFIVNGEWRTARGGQPQIPNAFGSTNNVLIASRKTAAGGPVHAVSFDMVGDEGRSAWCTPMGG